MKHAGAKALGELAPVIARLRAFDALREKSPGVFYCRSRAFLHFHEDEAGLFADLRGPGDASFERLPVNTAGDASALLNRVDQCLREARSARR